MFFKVQSKYQKKSWLRPDVEIFQYIGLWPDKVRYRLHCSLFIITLHEISCVLNLLWGVDTFQDITDALFSIFGMGICFSMALAFLYNRQAAAEIIRQINSDFYRTPLSERAEQRSNQVTKYTKYFVVFTAVGAVYLPTFMNLLNGSPHLYLALYVPPNSNAGYVYFLILFQCAYIVISPLIILSTVAFLVNIIHHICVQMNILQRALKSIKITTRKATRRNIRACIKHHQIIIKCMAQLQTLYGPICFVHNIELGAAASIMLFNFLLRESLSERLAVIGQLTFVAVDMVFLAYNAQKLITESTLIGETIYNMEWYELPPKMRKDLMFMIKRTQKPLRLHAITDELSLRACASTFRTIYSCLTLLLNMVSKK